MRKLLFIVPVLLFAGVAVYLWAGLSRDPELLPSALIDQPAPQFTLKPLGGKQDFARADLGHGVALVNFFASWCAPCRMEAPLLMDLSRSGSVPVYGIAYKDKPEASLAFLEQLGDPYQRVAQDEAGTVAIDWGVYGMPETFVVDARGRIRFRVPGPLTPEIVARDLKPLLARLDKEAAGG